MFIVNEQSQIATNLMFKARYGLSSYTNEKVLIEERITEDNCWDCGEDLSSLRKFQPNMLSEEEVQQIVKLLNKSAKIASAKVESNRVHIMLKLKNGNQTGMSHAVIREAIRNNSLKYFFQRYSNLH
ncbi:hypothetical protein [Pseudobacteroides cellulosolvens]|uniref:Uncharacterized protein n=1 Tax=Pseudobacteroides cellulosolvens ATCC 35603 = DSM 2933 TaxID=398512 RepID=A0A0L6JGX0_9FIRM|nr:hypothetical protein [Pseudobacteroides cellulosolvens]KNY24973.1 hypothetical protein Bccel_0230 [Pseudobacteroides cellulosolvens ATCC 35603 = DSM 2933]